MHPARARPLDRSNPASGESNGPLTGPGVAQGDDIVVIDLARRAISGVIPLHQLTGASGLGVTLPVSVRPAATGQQESFECARDATPADG